MSENNMSLKSFCLPYVLIVGGGAVVSRLFGVGFSSLPGDLLIFLSFCSLGLGVDLFCDRKRKSDILFVYASIILQLCGSFYLCFLDGNPSFQENFSAGIALSFPLMLTFPLVYRVFQKKRIAIIGALLTAFVCYFAVRSYIYSYTYLYLSIGQTAKHGSFYYALFLLTVVFLAVQLFFHKGRNYLGYVLLVIGIGGSIVEFMLRMNLSVTLGNILLSVRTNWLAVAFCLYLIIYMRAEKPEKRYYERRNVVFSNMVYQEVKPIKRKKKSPKFEVPPNVPVFRNCEKNESEE